MKFMIITDYVLKKFRVPIFNLVTYSCFLSGEAK